MKTESMRTSTGVHHSMINNKLVLNEQIHEDGTGSDAKEREREREVYADI